MSRTGIPGGPGGVTSATMLQPGDQLDRAVALVTERNGNASTRDDVEVISLTVGGNDLFTPAVAACVLSENPAVTCAPALQATFTGFAARYDQILTELRAAAGDDVVLMTTTYYNPLPFCTLGAGNPASGPVGDWILEGGTLPAPLPPLGTLDQGFNDIIRALSAEHGAVVADTFGTLGGGDFVGGSDCLHPNAAGHRALAEVFAASFPG
jgi:lysophospholipase L1-like esterase